MPDGGVALLRLTAQRIAHPARATPAEQPDGPLAAPSIPAVAASQLATQAQDLSGAKWALGLRARTTEKAVDAALTDGSVVRTWPARGTLMITARADVRWLTELLAPRAFAAAAAVWRRDGMVEADFARAAEVARAELQGTTLTRDALLDAFQRAGVETSRNRGSHLLRQLAGETLLVFGPPATNPRSGAAVQTFALLSEHAPDAEPRDRDDALHELAVRFFTGHGPATIHDLAWWSGLTVSDCRRAVTLAGDALAQDPAGRLTSAEHPPTPARRGDVRLLPPFDELLTGYRDRTAHLRDGDFARVVPASNGLFRPIVTVDGLVVGTWRRTLRTDGSVDVDIEPFEVLGDRVARAVDRRVDEYARFLGRSRYAPASG